MNYIRPKSIIFAAMTTLKPLIILMLAVLLPVAACAQKGVGKDGANVRLVSCASEVFEGVFVAKEIARMVGGLDMLGKGREERLRSFGEIAVLARTHRMLSVVPHIEVASFRGPLGDWRTIADDLLRVPGVRAAAPFVQGQGLFSSGEVVRGALVKGVDPELEPAVSGIAESVEGPDGLAALGKERFGVVLGRDLARQLRVNVGDKVALIVPQGSMTPAGMVPRVKQVRVLGLLSSGHYEYDSTMALLALEDAAAVFRTGGPQGLRLKVDDMNRAPEIARSIMPLLPSTAYAVDWSQQNRTWFAAVQVEKRMMGIILFLIVLVGAFGLVSTLVMTVKEKQSDIAILRTLGASRGSIMGIFIVQGTIVGLVGVAAGVALGLLVAFNVGAIVSFIEGLFGVAFLPREIYFISSMPSDPRMSDIVPIALFSFLLSLAATLYPSWRAASIQPAEALRYE